MERRIGVWLSRLGIALLALLLLVAMVVGAVVGTRTGRLWAAEQALALAPDAGVQVAVDGLDWPELGRIAFTRLALSDETGVWLEVGALQLDWQPTALFSAMLAIDRIDIGRVGLLRLPVTPTGETETTTEPPSLPTLPGSLRLGALDIRLIEIAPAVAGEAVSLTGGIAMRWPEQGALSLSAKLSEADAGRTALSADVGLDPAGELSVAMQAEDAAGGVLSKLLALPDWPGTRVLVEGKGPLADWQARYAAEVGTLADLKGSVTANLVDMSRIAVDGAGRVGGGLPALFGVAGLPDVTVALAAEMSDLQRLALRTLRVAAPASTLEVTGVLHADGRIEQLQIAATAGESDWTGLLPPDIGFAEARLDGNVSGTLDEPEVQARAVVDKLRGPEGITLAQAACALTLRPTAALVRADADCTFDRAAGEPVLEAALGPQAKLSVAASFAQVDGQVELTRLRLDGAQVAVEGTGTLLLPNDPAALPAVDGQATVRVADLAPMAKLYAVPVSGPLSLTLKGRSEETGAVAGRLAVDGKPRWPKGFGLPPPVMGAVAASTEFALSPELALSLKGGRLAVGQVRGSFAGTAQLPEGALALTAAVALPDSSALPLPVGTLAAGASEVNLTIGGTIPAPHIEGQARVPDLTLPQLVLRDPRAGFTVALSGADIDAAVHLLTEIAGETASVEGSASLREQDRVQIHALTVSGPGLSLQGAVGGLLTRNLWQGRLTLEAADLSVAAAPFGQTVGGSATAAIDLTATEGRQAVAVAARVSGLSWAQGSTAVLADRVTVDARAQDLFGTPALSATAAARGVVTPGLSIGEVAAEANGALNDMSWTLKLTAERQAPLALTADGTAAVEGETVRVVMRRLDGTLAAAPVSLRRPLTVELAPDRQGLSGLALGIGDGRIEGEAAMEAETLRSRLSIEALPLGPFAQFAAGMPVAGNLNLSSNLDWTAARQSLTAEAKVAGLSLEGEGEDWPPLDIALTADWQGKTMAFDGTIDGIGAAPGKFAARLPLVAGARPPEAELRQDGPLSGQLTWQGEIGPLIALLPLSEHRLSGQGALDLAVEGTVAEPRLAGEARLNDGAYEHLHWGTRLANLTLVASGDSAGSLVLQGSADDTKQGTLAVEGAVKLDEPAHPSGWVTVKLDTLHALARDELMGEVSADLRAEGDLKDVLLSGRTTVDRMEIQIPDRLPPSVVDLEVQEVGEPTRAPPPEPEEKTGPGPVTRLDLVVSMPARVFVRGRGLDSEWGGELTITGTSRKPRIVGTLQVIRGKFSFAGRTFDISSGTLRFPGGDEVEPVLDIAIQHSRAELSATIKLSGPVSAPTLSLTSQPTLPDDEILARVIFGKSVRELTPLQSLQLAQSVAQISGALGGGGVMDTLRQTLGVDALTVDSGEDGPKVGVGKYLLDNVYVGVRQGATAGSGELAAEIELTPSISLESEIGQDARSNIDLNWHHDY